MSEYSSSASKELSRRGFVGLLAATSGAILGTRIIGTHAVHATAAGVPSGFPQTHFPYPDRIRYDHQCFTIDNKDTIIYSGSFHYFRCAKPLWAQRFAQIRAAGFNAVESYIAWDLHERNKPRNPDDYSGIDLTDLDDWLTLAEQHGLHVIIRPGPYICAEYNTGGFPRWLLAETPRNHVGPWLRSDDPWFIKWSVHWYRAVCPILARHQITRKKPGEKGIILFQLENEYNYSGLSAPIGRRYIAALAACAVQQGIEVPLFTNDSNCIIGSDNPVLEQICDGQDWYPGKNVTSIKRDVDFLRQHQRNAPVFTPEVQGGWFDAVVWPPSLRTDSDNYAGLGPRQINNLTLYCLQQGVKMMNYYMLFGGTNFGNHAARDIATSYDYSAPIRECGGIGSKYQAVAAIALMLQQHGPSLARAEPIACQAHTGHADVEAAVRRAVNGDVYIFLRTSNQHRSFTGHAVVSMELPEARSIRFDYQLEPFGSKLLYVPADGRDSDNGVWLPETVKPIPRPPATTVPKSVKVSQALFHADPGPQHYKTMQRGQAMEFCGLYDNQLVYYRSRVVVDGPSSRKLFLSAQIVGIGSGSLLINGQPAAMASGKYPGQVAFEAGDLLRSGENIIELLFASSGNPNTNTAIAELSGVTDIFIAPHLPGQTALRHWRMRHIQKTASPAELPEIRPAHDDATWAVVQVNKKGNANQLQPNQWAVFRHEFMLTQDQITDTIRRVGFSHIDNNGWVFINGRLVGTTDNWNRPCTFDISSELHAGKNVLAVVVKNVSGGGGIAGATLSWSAGGPGTRRGTMELSADSLGLAQRWMEPNLEDSAWTGGALPMQRDQQLGLLHWYRMHFSMPEAPRDMWVPWCLRMNAKGSGYIYLNGHNLGRYWQHGGQREFYLPECWMECGSGRKNVITLQLRAVGGQTAIEFAEIVPYRVYAQRV